MRDYQMRVTRDANHIVGIRGIPTCATRFAKFGRGVSSVWITNSEADGCDVVIRAFAVSLVVISTFG